MTAQAELPVPPPAPEAERRGIFQWFWRGAALKRARAAVKEQPELEQQRLARARAAAEAGGRLLDPVDPLEHGPGVWLSLTLYREAAYWALLGQSEAAMADDLAQAFENSPRSLLLLAADGEERLTNLQSLLFEKSSSMLLEEPLEQQRASVGLVKDFVEALLREKLGPKEAVEQVMFERGARIGTLVALVFAAAIGASVGLKVATRGPDIAAGKPWKTSSKQDECHPAAHQCLGTHTNILFHTRDEKNPWYQVDLGKAQTFSRVEIKNRDDCCPDRAIPLVVEISNDEKKWREVSRRTDTFSTWEARFAPTKARYVRVRVLRRTILHLERVSVRVK